MADVLGKISEPFKQGFEQVKRFFTLNDFDVVHDVSATPPLGKEVGILPSKLEGEPIKVVLLDKISSSPDSVAKSLLGGKSYVRTILKENNERFGLEFKATKGYYELVYTGDDENRDGNKAVAVCRKDSSGKIRIFGFEPLYSEQQPSDVKHDDCLVYAYYEFKEPQDNTYSSHKIAVVNEKGPPAYSVHQAGLQGVGNNLQHIVRLHNKPCALIEDPKGKDSSGSFNITVNPGVDPCLIIFLAALCVKLDAEEEEGNIFERFGKEIIS